MVMASFFGGICDGFASLPMWEAFERLARCQPKSSIDGHQVLAAARRDFVKGMTCQSFMV